MSRWPTCFLALPHSRSASCFAALGKRSFNRRKSHPFGSAQALHKIDDTWAGLDLTFAPYQDTDVHQMSIEDAVMEALESDNLALQNMSGGKYVQVSSGAPSTVGRHFLSVAA